MSGFDTSTSDPITQLFTAMQSGSQFYGSGSLQVFLDDFEHDFNNSPGVSASVCLRPGRGNVTKPLDANPGNLLQGETQWFDAKLWAINYDYLNYMRSVVRAVTVDSFKHWCQFEDFQIDPASYDQYGRTLTWPFAVMTQLERPVPLYSSSVPSHVSGSQHIASPSSQLLTGSI